LATVFTLNKTSVQREDYITDN